MSNIILALVISAMHYNWARHYLIDNGMTWDDAEFITWQARDHESKFITGNIHKIIQYLEDLNHDN